MMTQRQMASKRKASVNGNLPFHGWWPFSMVALQPFTDVAIFERKVAIGGSLSFKASRPKEGLWDPVENMGKDWEIFYLGSDNFKNGQAQ